MKIKEVSADRILFDNGSQITYDHEQDCCEWNYADFKNLDSDAYSYDFDKSLWFKEEKYGFSFGDTRRRFFIPCYSEQNGYYSNDVDIYLNDRLVLSAICEEIIE